MQMFGKSGLGYSTEKTRKKLIKTLLRKLKLCTYVTVPTCNLAPPLSSCTPLVAWWVGACEGLPRRDAYILVINRIIIISILRTDMYLYLVQ